MTEFRYVIHFFYGGLANYVGTDSALPIWQRLVRDDSQVAGMTYSGSFV
jgi:hypothetical protein